MENHNPWTKEERRRFLDTGKYLTEDRSLSSKYSQIAGVPVKVYIDRAHGFPVVYYKGKRIMELTRGNTPGEQQRVRKHFRRVRYGTQDYKENWDVLRENERDRERRAKDARQDLAETQADAHAFYLGYGKRSVVVNGGKKNA